MTEVEFNCACGYVFGGDRERVVAVGAEKCCRQRRWWKSYWVDQVDRKEILKTSSCSEFVPVGTEVL